MKDYTAKKKKNTRNRLICEKKKEKTIQRGNQRKKINAVFGIPAYSELTKLQKLP